jgi:tripartite-type tricarboxylate transporter receptor subunit TctC
MTAALTGEVQIGFTLMSVRPHVSAGRLRVLAIIAKHRCR